MAVDMSMQILIVDDNLAALLPGCGLPHMVSPSALTGDLPPNSKLHEHTVLQTPTVGESINAGNGTSGFCRTL